jgi:hypothetical protein
MDNLPHFLAFDGFSNMIDGHSGSGFGVVPMIYLVYYSEFFWLRVFLYIGFGCCSTHFFFPVNMIF